MRPRRNRIDARAELRRALDDRQSRLRRLVRLAATARRTTKSKEDPSHG